MSAFDLGDLHNRESDGNTLNPTSEPWQLRSRLPAYHYSSRRGSMDGRQAGGLLHLLPLTFSFLSTIVAWDLGGW